MGDQKKDLFPYRFGDDDSKIFEKLKMIFLLFCFYLLSYGLSLLNPGIYWDDWGLVNVKSFEILEAFKQSGLPIFGYWHIFLLSLPNSILIYRILVFLFYFFSGIFLFAVLNSIKELSSALKFIIVTFFLLFPVNYARIALINSPAALCNFVFFLAFWLLSQFMKKRNVLLRILILLLFYFSFFINSFLCFYLIVLVYIIFKSLEESKKFSHLFRFLDFFLLPLVYWYIQTTYFKTYGFYKGYHQITLKNLAKAVYTSFQSFNMPFIEIIRLSIIDENLVFVLIGTVIIFFLLKHNFKKNKKFLRIKSGHLSLLGILILYLGVFPYNVAGSGVVLSDWNSRNQLLIPLGASLIMYFGVETFTDYFKIRSSFKYILYSLLIFSFIYKNIDNSLKYQADWFKQDSLIENFKDNKVISKNTSFLFRDNCSALNAYGREYRFYEFSGLMSAAFNNQRRFGVLESHFEEKKSIDSYEPYLNPKYKLKDFKLKNPEYLVEIECPGGTISVPKLFKLIYLKYFDKAKYRLHIKTITALNTGKT